MKIIFGTLLSLLLGVTAVNAQMTPQNDLCEVFDTMMNTVRFEKNGQPVSGINVQAWQYGSNVVFSFWQSYTGSKRWTIRYEGTCKNNTITATLVDFVGEEAPKIQQLPGSIVNRSRIELAGRDGANLYTIKTWGAIK